MVWDLTDGKLVQVGPKKIVEKAWMGWQEVGREGESFDRISDSGVCLQKDYITFYGKEE